MGDRGLSFRLHNTCPYFASGVAMDLILSPGDSRLSVDSVL